MGLPNVDNGVRPDPNTELICDTFVRLSRLKASTTRSSLPWGLMSKYLRIRRSNVTDDGSRSAFLGMPSVRDVKGNARDWLSSPPVMALTGVPVPTVKMGAISMWLKAQVHALMD